MDRCKDLECRDKESIYDKVVKGETHRFFCFFLFTVFKKFIFNIAKRYQRIHLICSLALETLSLHSAFFD